jgi:hypothetical protein
VRSVPKFAEVGRDARSERDAHVRQLRSQTQSRQSMADLSAS